MTTLLIDADGLAYQAAAAAQKGIAWDDEIYTVHADFAEAKRCLSNNVAALLTGSECDDLVLCWSKGPYFRKDVLPSYKANRKGSQPPLCFRDLRAWAFERFTSREVPGLEADDIVGIMATRKPGRILYSPDKDLLQIPGLHYKPGEGVYRISAEFAQRQLWLQVLTGDKSDGYTGIPGCGPKKAEAILANCHTTEDYEVAVSLAYEKAGITPVDMAAQVNVARILTASTYDFKRKEPLLWPN